MTILALLPAMLLVSATAVTGTADSTPAETPRRVFIAARDAGGAPVTDLTAADVTVKEGGQDRVVASLEPATDPLQVSILVDDGGTGFFQAPVAQFIVRTFGRAEYAISMLNPQPVKVIDYTADAPALGEAVGKLKQRGRVERDWLQLIEAVAWAANDLRARNATRPVILAITDGGEPGSSDIADGILSNLKDSGASLHVLYVNGVTLGKVLNEGSMNSGGMQANGASTQSMAEASTRVATLLLSQYELTYMLPDGASPRDRLEVRTTRPGVTLVAPERISTR